MTNTQTTTSTDINEVVSALGVLRRTQGMSQVALGERSGVPQKTISRMESNKTIPTFKTLQSIADVFGYEIEVTLAPKKEEK